MASNIVLHGLGTLLTIPTLYTTYHIGGMIALLGSLDGKKSPFKTNALMVVCMGGLPLAASCISYGTPFAIHRCLKYYKWI